MSKTYIVTVSGGKDSTATLLHLKYDLDLPVEAVFSDTGHDEDGPSAPQQEESP